MKKNLTKILALSSVALLMLASCKKDGTLVTSNGGKPGTLTASTTSLPLDKSKVNDASMVISFTFTAPNFGFSAAVTNTLQIDAAGDNWAHPASAVLATNVLTQGYSTADFNNLVLKLNLPAGTASQVQVRVVNSLGANVAPVYSNVVNITVTPFNLTSWVYVPGSYEGWGNGSGTQIDSLISVTGNGVYTGIINFPSGKNDFLIVPVNGSWANKWATTASAATGTSATYATEYVTGGGNNFFAPTAAGQYLLTFDSNAGSLSIVPADFYSVIGSSTPGGDWSTDLFLKYINDGNNNWVGTFSLSAGEFKFRQDAAWANSWGIPQAGTAGAGVANTVNDSKNDNVKVATTGTYTVTFNMGATVFGATPPVTTTYSVK